MKIANSVAEWLDSQANKKEIRDTALSHGVSTAKLRAKLNFKD